jgi:uncharacterized protein with PIN domain
MLRRYPILKYFVSAITIIWISGIFYFSCDQQKEGPAVVEKIDTKNSKYELMDAQYVGSESCKSCHEVEYHDWKGSHHERAMMVAHDSSVLANFDTTFISQGVTSRFYMKGDKYFVNTEGPDGNYEDYEIIYTFGIEPLQQYIVEFPGGAFQCLRTAWDTEKNVWFDLYPEMKLVHDEWIHWTNGGLNWNTMCSDCHSTLVKKDYNPVKKTFNTTYSLINVSCEACHGPGREHVELTAAPDYDSTKYMGQLYMGKYTLPKQMWTIAPGAIPCELSLPSIMTMKALLWTIMRLTGCEMVFTLQMDRYLEKYMFMPLSSRARCMHKISNAMIVTMCIHWS